MRTSCNKWSHITYGYCLLSLDLESMGTSVNKHVNATYVFPSLTILPPWLRNINFIERTTSSTERSGSNTTNSEEPGTVSLHLACCIACSLDMFCDLNEVIGICLLLEDEENTGRRMLAGRFLTTCECIRLHIGNVMGTGNPWGSWVWVPCGYGWGYGL